MVQFNSLQLHEPYVRTHLTLMREHNVLLTILIVQLNYKQRGKATPPSGIL